MISPTSRLFAHDAFVGTPEDLESLHIWFDGSVPETELAALPDLDGLSTEGHRSAAVLQGSVRPLLRFLADQPVSYLQIQEPDLEEAFLGLYEESS